MKKQIKDTATTVNPDPVTTKRRPLLFALVYFGGAALASVLFEESLLIGLIGIFFALYYLPWGLVILAERYLGLTLITNQPGVSLPEAANGLATFLILLSYALIFVTAVAGSIVPRQRVFQFLFIVFFVLIILSVGGCYAVRPGQ